MNCSKSNLFTIQLCGWMCGVYPWDQRNLHAPFWHLFFNLTKGGFLNVGGRRLAMLPGNFYLLPAGIEFSTETEMPLAQFFVHFNLSEEVGQVPGHLFTIPGDSFAERYIQEYITLYRNKCNCNTPRSSAIAAMLLGHVLLQCPQNEIFVDLPRDLRIQECISYINDNLRGRLDNSWLAKMFFLARNSFVRLFTEMTSESPQAYIRRRRIEYACQMLRETDYSIKEIAEEAGFANQFHFSKVFQRLQRCSPRTYRQSLHSLLNASKSKQHRTEADEDFLQLPRLRLRPCRHIPLDPGDELPIRVTLQLDADKVKTFAEKFEEHFIDSDTGLAYSSINPDTLHPGTPSFFQRFGSLWYLRRPGIPIHELFKFLNSNMVTADYLRALTLQRRLHGNSRELSRRLHRTIEALFMVAECGKELEDGFLPLLFGGKISIETDAKQCLSIVAALEDAYPYLTRGEQQRASRLIAKAASFWMKRDYRYHFFNAEDDTYQWQLQYFPPMLALAYKHSGDEAFRLECRRLQPNLKTPYYTQFSRRPLPRELQTGLEERLGGCVIAEAADHFYANADIFDLSYRLVEADETERSLWHSTVLACWEDVRYSMTAEGSYYSWQLFSFPDMIPFRIPCAAASFMDNAGSTSCRGTIIARGALQLCRHIPELRRPALTAATTVLEHMDFETMFELEQPERLQKAQLVKSQVLDGLSAVNWLWTALLLEDTLKP